MENEVTRGEKIFLKTKKHLKYRFTSGYRKMKIENVKRFRCPAVTFTTSDIAVLFSPGVN